MCGCHCRVERRRWQPRNSTSHTRQRPHTSSSGGGKVILLADGGFRWPVGTLLGMGVWGTAAHNGAFIRDKDTRDRNDSSGVLLAICGDNFVRTGDGGTNLCATSGIVLAMVSSGRCGPGAIDVTPARLTPPALPPTTHFRQPH
jgi:hypothetical protein